MSEKLLTIREAAALCRVSTRQLYKLRASGRFPEFVRLGRSVRVRESELDAFIQAGCKVIKR
jgi:excisionase family DNA binding protein